ncbi:Pentatricopeptide repeat-containing protein [Camellia lanceoleosa]|uniref:Pentatricopeptide repeat-containing protein n=1 Tax=Camellia lanceoleosa TaxID=1840588 RepID=A0ACC0GHZ7_9ERIC|nr:Pentatricopeptide repeat-containing protein [Camellia lanceoleosa]
MDRSSSIPNPIKSLPQSHFYVHRNHNGGRKTQQFRFPDRSESSHWHSDFNCGEKIHAASVKLGYSKSLVTVANSLINMYGKCRDIRDVFKVFDRIPQRDQVSWNSMISALCQFEEWEIALEAFRMMQSETVELSSFTLVSVALACSNCMMGCVSASKFMGTV